MEMRVTPAEASAGGPTRGAGRADVLLADDEPLFTATLRDILVDQGYQVVTATDGLAALALARRHRPAVAFLDLAMPHLDGEAVCRTLLAEPGPPKVVIVTGRASNGRARRLLDMGALEVVIKPAPVGYLLQIVAEVCGARAAPRITLPAAEPAAHALGTAGR